MTFDESCIFCKIAHKKALASVIYEDEVVMAFLDIRPLTVGHSLVIPRTHYIEVFGIPQDLLCNVYKVSKIVAIAVKKTTQADGISIIQQNGTAAGQDIFHLHVHVIPRFEGQKLPSFSDLKEAERAKLDGLAKKIKKDLGKF